MPIILIDNTDSFTYNLYQMLQSRTASEVQVHRNHLGFDELLTLKPERVILSPGPGHPKNEKDFGVCRDIIIRWAELNCPVLGVCLGFQGMILHQGGAVAHAPEVRHGKTSPVNILKDSPLFAGMESPFEVMRYHSLCVSRANFPPDFEITAESADDGVIMAARHRERPLYGVQFHPESIGTPSGQRLLDNFLAL